MTFYRRLAVCIAAIQLCLQVASNAVRITDTDSLLGGLDSETTQRVTSEPAIYASILRNCEFGYYPAAEAILAGLVADELHVVLSYS